jgi:hypothetical protein
VYGSEVESKGISTDFILGRTHELHHSSLPFMGERWGEREIKAILAL